MEEPVQKSLERYDVLDRIAVGGMAEVFLAKAYGAHGFEKTLAIKRILPELASDPEFAARFIAEAKVAVRLSHANIVQVFDFGRIGESLFIAMEYVDGLDLAAMLRKFKDEGRQVPLPAAFHIAIEIIRALDFAHGHNVVHRDVSPSNILISRAGEVKIADFGIAVAAQPHRGGGPGPRKVMGKWRYMSPEQARGDTLDTRSDLFSAASVIYELFTGTKLFPGEEAEDIAKNIHEMPIPRMTSIRPGLPSRLDDVLGQALARKPIDRPSRPATVLRSLIELSYESSIMATALDVAEALATVIPAKRTSGRGALDDVIRKQLNDQPTAARRTAVTDGKPPATETNSGEPATSTGLFRKLGADGLARLEVDDTKVAGPRARRSSEVPVMPGDTDVHRLFGQAIDKDRHTEVGGPPTGTVPKDLELPPDEVAPLRARTTGSNKSITTDVGARDADVKKPPTLWIVIGVLVAGAAGAGIFALTRPSQPDQPVIDTTKRDAAVVAPPPAKTGTVEIVTTPPGASGTINDQAFTRPTPFEAVNVPAGKARIHLELPGYLPLDYELEIVAGVKIMDRQTFAAAPAALKVTTDPVGVTVTLAGRGLGVTPLARTDLSAVKDATLVLSKAGFETQSFKVTLEAGKQLDVDRTLKAAQKFGIAQIRVVGGFGDVYLAGKKLGSAPTKSIRLPVGTNRLHIVNPVAKIEWDLTCTVTEDGPNICETKQP
ncbi:MAG: serine/threonine protein kinase [Myxococcales bacterium]|nr:serine/threonine protein kinase [Myxococcales bacterium]